MQLSFLNRGFLKQAIILHNVIDSRRSQLEDMKNAFRSTGILDFICMRPYLWDAAFPPIGALEYTPDMVLDHITFEGQDPERMKLLVDGFLREISSGTIFEKSSY
jgi:hypothetical protein